MARKRPTIDKSVLPFAPSKRPAQPVDKRALTHGERPRLKDDRYRLSAHGRACMVCGRRDGSVVLAHIATKTNSGMGRKPDDSDSLWLCAKHHNEFDTSTNRAEWLVDNILLPLRRLAYQRDPKRSAA